MNAPIFKPSSTGHFSLLKKNATFQAILRSILFMGTHYVIALEMAASTASGFLSHPFAQEVSTPTRKNPWADCSIRW